MSFTGENKISSKISNLHERLENWFQNKTKKLKHSSSLCQLLHSHCCFAYIQAYHDPMLKLSIMTEEELAHIFGDLDAYIPLHEGE